MTETAEVTTFAGDAEAEAAVLAGCLNDPKATPAARRSLTPASFFRGDNAMVFTAIAELDDRGVTPDPFAVYEQLRRTEALTADLALRIHTLYAYPYAGPSLPWAIRRVANLARQRERSLLARRIGQIGSEVADPDAMATALIRECVQLEALIEYEADDETIPGLTTWEDFIARPARPGDAVVPGLLDRQEVVMILAAPGVGKALAVDTPILTDAGWRTMGDLAVGDRVFGPDGRPTSVRATTPVMHGRPCYRVQFSDGAEIVADAEHLWQTQNRSERAAGRSSTRTTAELAGTLREADGHARHAIQVAAPVSFPDAALPFPPYTLGAWLGDGTGRAADITCADPEILEGIREDGFDVRRVNSRLLWGIRSDTDRAERLAAALKLVENGAGVRQAERCVGIGRGALNQFVDSGSREWTTRPPVLSDPGWSTAWRTPQQRLRDLGVLRAKHIPEPYFRASIAQRVALLQGLMDTDGTIGANGRAEFSVTNERLARDAHRLVVELGHKATLGESDAKLDGRFISRRWRISFVPNSQIFRVWRKAIRVRPSNERNRRRYVVAVEPVESVPVRCIEVERRDGLYLAGRNLITTHNSWLSRQVALSIAAGLHPFHAGKHITPMRSLLVDLENPESTVQRQVADPYNAIRVLGGAELGQRGWFWPHTEGLNIRKRADAALLERVIADTRPDIVCIGSLYNLFHRGSSDWDTAAEETIAVLNRLRARYNCALWIEHHMPKAEGGGHRTSPFGSSLWERWPSYGRVISRIGAHFYALSVFRGDREAGREFPVGLQRGGKLPWSPIWEQEELDMIKENFS